MQILKLLWKIPLIKIIFWVTCGWFVIPGLLIFWIGRELIGFWKCQHCHKWYWVNENKNANSGYHYFYTLCDSCQETYNKRYNTHPLPPKLPVKKKIKEQDNE